MYTLRSASLTPAFECAISQGTACIYKETSLHIWCDLLVSQFEPKKKKKKK